MEMGIEHYSNSEIRSGSGQELVQNNKDTIYGQLMSLEEAMDTKEEKISKSVSSDAAGKIMLGQTKAILMKTEEMDEDRIPVEPKDIKINIPRKPSGYPSPTAYRAVAAMAQDDRVPIKMVLGYLTDDGGDRSHLWRCIITCLNIEVTADSVRKVIAREVACQQLLTQLMVKERKTFSSLGIRIPSYETPKEMFIDPKVLQELRKEVRSRGMKIYQGENRNRPFKEGELITIVSCIYIFTGTKIKKFKGQHVISEYATLLAAEAAYAFVTGEKLKPTLFFKDAKCDRSLKYNYSEPKDLKIESKIEDNSSEKNCEYYANLRRKISLQTRAEDAKLMDRGNKEI